ncbi:MAG: response regulator [Candidatus Aminicenantes bacterium]|nr:response regulator [Candidatus Aminicenantes bacterium]
MSDSANILIVDDNVSQCKTMAFIMQRKGYTVSIAENGPQAIEMVEKQPFDIIFMDIKMPLMNGVEAYKRIKKIRPDTKVMMMTAYAVEDLVQQALEEGAFGIIYKPIDIEKILELVETARQNNEGALILVVDDDPSTCTTLKNILIKKGFRVGIAHTGEEAIETAGQETYDIIFIDMKLPTLNGLETYLAIKKVNPRAVAVMMTGYRQEMAELVETALYNNAYACLYKPLNMKEMLNLTNEILERKKEKKDG